MFWLDVENHYPALARQITCPVIVRDHNLMIFRHASSGNECAAVPGSSKLRRLGGFLLLVEPREIVVGHFLKGVERHNVVHVEIDSVRLDAIGDALQLPLIFDVDVGPKHLPRRGAKELPIPLRRMRVKQFDRLKRVGDLGREKITVLVADIRWAAFDVYVRPPALLEAISLLQSRVGLGCSRCRRHRRATECQGEAEHASIPQNLFQHEFLSMTVSKSSAYRNDPTF